VARLVAFLVSFLPYAYESTLVQNCMQTIEVAATRWTASLFFSTFFSKWRLIFAGGISDLMEDLSGDLIAT